MRIRGVIEGFYGPPWPHRHRLDWIDRLHAWGMTHFVWAAKAEPRHRDDWRAPFTSDELAQFGELARRRAGVALGVGLTPGPGATATELVVKLAPAVGAGASVVVLSCDDLPALDDGAAHRDLAHRLLAELRCPVWIVPTHYCGTEPSAYLSALCRDLDPAIEVMWTGGSVVNDRIDADDARRWTARTGRLPLLWDNTPVNDAVMGDALHLGPLSGRDRALRDHCSGVLWNPMEHPLASTATIASAAAWCAGADPLAAWRDHVGARGWSGLAAATAFAGDPHWLGDDPDRASWEELLASLPERAEEVGLDASVQPWIDAARQGARIAVDAHRLAERLAGGAAGTAASLRLLGLAARWRDWRRSPVLTYGAGPRLRPILTQDGRGEFLAETGSVSIGPSSVDAAVARVLALPLGPVPGAGRSVSS
jgi:hypothetical protein